MKKGVSNTMVIPNARKTTNEPQPLDIPYQVVWPACPGCGSLMVEFRDRFVCPDCEKAVPRTLAHYEATYVELDAEAVRDEGLVLAGEMDKAEMIRRDQTRQIHRRYLEIGARQLVISNEQLTKEKEG